MPRPDVSEERKAQILEAASRVFARSGIDAASVAEVARESGISKATIYHYFESKESLIEALVHKVFAADLLSLAAIVNSQEPAPARLRAYSQELVALLNENVDLWPLMAEVRARAGRLPEVDAILRNAFDRYIDAFALVIEQGIERGELRPDLGPRDGALAWVALVEGALIVAEHAHTPLEETMERCVEVFVMSNGV